MNEYDSARIGDILHAQCGMSETEQAEEADLLLLNTCSVREKPQEKVFHQLGRWKKLKEQHPDLLIAVGGCVASQEGAALGERAPFVDIIFGPQTVHRLPELIANAKARSQSIPVVDISFPEIEKFDRLPTPRVGSAQAYLSVMEGCSRYCSFCVVPYTRGEEFSRPLEQVLDEARALASQGVSEITLLGQNVNAYNGAGKNGENYNFADLLYAVAELDHIQRIRFTTSHPLMFGRDLVDAYADIDKLASHLHLPVQSGSDRILAAMKRGYTALEYRHTIRALRAARPDISISSDFIVGFPGESEGDFEDTMQLVRDIGFDRSFSFLYSPRPGTPAAGLCDNVSLDDKKQRLYRLQKLLNEQEKNITKNMIGSIQNILVEGLSARSGDELQGRCANNHMVVFAHEQAHKIIGTYVPVHIDSASSHSLRGSVHHERAAQDKLPLMSRDNLDRIGY